MKETDVNRFKQDVMQNIDQVTYDLEFGENATKSPLFEFNFTEWTN